MDLSETDAKRTIKSILEKVTRNSSGRIPLERLGFLKGLVGRKYSYLVDEVAQKLETQSGGANKKKLYNGRAYIVRSGPSGAKYISVNGMKKYLSSM